MSSSSPDFSPWHANENPSSSRPKTTKNFVIMACIFSELGGVLVMSLHWISTARTKRSKTALRSLSGILSYFDVIHGAKANPRSCTGYENLTARIDDAMYLKSSTFHHHHGQTVDPASRQPRREHRAPYPTRRSSRQRRRHRPDHYIRDHGPRGESSISMTRRCRRTIAPPRSCSIPNSRRTPTGSRARFRYGEKRQSLQCVETRRR